MPTWDDIENLRISEAEAAAKATEETVRGLQGDAYAAFLEWLTGQIDVKDGRLTYNARNLGRVQGVYRLFKSLQKNYQKTLLGDVLEWAGRIFGLNRDYFETFDKPAASVEDEARRLTLQRWGYDVTKKELIPGGYFESLFSNADTARRVAGLVNRAIAAKMPLADFQKLFRGAFVGQRGHGMLERHWQTNSFDLYQRIDRSANLVYADKLGLDYAIYSGTIMKNSRQFCRDRVHKVFSREEIDGWRKLNWQGKPEIGYDPYLDCGGYRCRHHLSFVSDQIAATLRPGLKNA